MDKNGKRLQIVDLPLPKQKKKKRLPGAKARKLQENLSAKEVLERKKVSYLDLIDAEKKGFERGRLHEERCFQQKQSELITKLLLPLIQDNFLDTVLHAVIDKMQERIENIAQREVKVAIDNLST